MRDWRVGRPGRRLWAGAVLAPLVLGRSSAAVVVAAAVGFAVLILVLVVAAVALGAAFGRCADRRRACLQVLQTLVKASPVDGQAITCRRPKAFVAVTEQIAQVNESICESRPVPLVGGTGEGSSPSPPGEER